VDTFEAEESIDINAIAKEIKALEKQMESIDKRIADFCKQLKISPPF